MPDEPTKPKPIIKRTLPDESHAERKIKSVYTESDIVEVKKMVASMRKPGSYLQKGKVEKISAAAVKQLFNVTSEN